jgi:enoyl-CoA hydratase/carnithine racemase
VWETAEMVFLRMIRLRCFSSEVQKKLVTVTEVEKGIFHVLLNRPEKMNALSLEMFETITSTAVSLRENKAIRAVILSGNGKAFCTGLDVKSVAVNPLNFPKLLNKPGQTQSSNLAQDVAYMWRQLPFPVIASLHGMCFGGGLQIAMGADFRISTPDCQLSVMEAKWGLIPDMSASVTFRENVRMDVIKELTMTARIFSGTQAQTYGFVTRSSPHPPQSLPSLPLLSGAMKILSRDRWSLLVKSPHDLPTLLLPQRSSSRSPGWPLRVIAWTKRPSCRRSYSPPGTPFQHLVGAWASLLCLTPLPQISTRSESSTSLHCHPILIISLATLSPPHGLSGPD